MAGYPTFLVAASLSLLSSIVAAETTVKIGLITTLSGPDAPFGRDMVDGFSLGIQQAGDQPGGLPSEIFINDDQGRADFGRVHAERAIQRERVDILTGPLSSDILIAVADIVVRERREVFLINGGAGPAALAGKRCHPNFFSVAAQNEAMHETMGRHLTSLGLKRIYVLAPNTADGKDAVSAVKRQYRGEVVAEIYTKPGQTNFAAEIEELRNSNADAVYVAFTGATSAAFLAQHAAAGLTARIPLFAAGTALDQRVLTTLDTPVIRAFGSAVWSERLANPVNEAFVRDFQASFGRLPGSYAAHGYDAARLIDAALRQAGGIANRPRFRDALRNADFRSVRGQFKFNRNQFPVETHYLVQVARDEQGRPANFIRGVILGSHADSYAAECRMKW